MIGGKRDGWKGPGTRQGLLPLLSFEPDGVGRFAAARPKNHFGTGRNLCQTEIAMVDGIEFRGRKEK